MISKQSIRRVCLSVLFMAILQITNAQSVDSMLRGNQKFGVVVAVLTIILSVLLVVLFFLERRLKKLESKAK